MIFKIIKIFFENRRKTSKLVETFREPSAKKPAESISKTGDCRFIKIPMRYPCHKTQNSSC